MYLPTLKYKLTHSNYTQFQLIEKIQNVIKKYTHYT